MTYFLEHDICSMLFDRKAKSMQSSISLFTSYIAKLQDSLCLTIIVAWSIAIIFEVYIVSYKGFF